MIVVSVSVSFYKSCSADSEHLALLLSSIQSALKHFLPAPLRFP